MNYLNAFIVCGLICALSELIKQLFHLTIGHMTVLFVILGCFLEFGDVYDHIISFGGAGATLPITSFGHSLAESAYLRALEDGYLGVFTGLFDKTSGGISLTIFLAILISMIFRPKS